MKKLFFILAVGALASCGSNSTETKVTDSTTVKTDSVMKTDTIVKKIDSTTSKTDSIKK